MKKIFVILLCFAICISICSCEKLGPNDTTQSGISTSDEESNNSVAKYEESIWDGSIADSFQKGDGSESSPYEIINASQFALLAKRVNEGNQYEGKYFSLLCDIDLNNIDWTPIGNGIYSFMGNFDGKGHTIKNLKISQSIHYTYKYPTGREASYFDTGLFATIQDATIQNMVIDGATIMIANTQNAYTGNIGILCGTARTYQSYTIVSNIKIQNAAITTNFSAKQSPRWLSVGGAIGYIYAYNNTNTTISIVETNSTLSLEKGYGSINNIGTILGSSNILDSMFNMENCAAYQTLSVSPEQYYYTFTDNFCGMIGNAQASEKPFSIKNVFSKLTLNKPASESATTSASAITSHVIIGEAYYFAYKDAPNAIGYKFENVFGCVEHVDAKTGEKNFFTDLYVLPEGTIFSQINCCGCETLPQNHGFNTNIWDLSDLTRPKLKKQ